jgi:hypothetical protein
MYTNFWLENLKGRDHVRAGRRWSDDIRIDLRELWWEGVEWFHLALDSDK